MSGSKLYCQIQFFLEMILTHAQWLNIGILHSRHFMSQLSEMLIYYQTLYCQIPPDILTNHGRIWQTFRWAKYWDDESKYKAVIGRKVSDNIFVMHFCQFQPKNCDAKCILLATGNWLDLFDSEIHRVYFQNIILIYLWLVLEWAFDFESGKRHQE